MLSDSDTEANFCMVFVTDEPASHYNLSWVIKTKGLYIKLAQLQTLIEGSPTDRGQEVNQIYQAVVRKILKKNNK